MSRHLPAGEDRGRQLRIAQIIGQLNVGGAERHFVNLLNAMPRHQRYAILVGRERPGVRLDDALDPAVEVRALPIRRRSVLSGVRRLASLLRELRCDVVQTHMFWSNLCGSVAARIAGVPVVITTEHGENRWKRGWHRVLERRLISRLADRRFCVSPEIMRRRGEIDRVPPEKLELVPNGTQLTSEPVEAVEREVLTIGTVGRIVPEKDHGNLVAAVALLRQQGRRLRVCIVGDGPGLEELKARVAAEGLSADFEFPGMVTDVENWYRRFDVFVLSSSQEGQPVALLEAMAAGLPCVATDVGAIASTLASGSEGTIVPAGSASDLAAGLALYLGPSEIRAAHGKAARERIRREFSIEAVAERHLDTYRALLATASGGAS